MNATIERVQGRIRENRKSLLRHGINILSLILLLLLLDRFYPLQEVATGLKAGEVAPFDLIAPFSFEVRKNPEELREEQETAARKVPPIFDFIPVSPETLHSRALRMLAQNPVFEPDSARVLQAAERFVAGLLEKGVLPAGVQIPTSVIQVRRKGQMATHPVKAFYELDEAARRIQEEAQRRFPEDSARQRLFVDIGLAMLEPNLRLNTQLTRAAQDSARQAVSPIKRVIKRGERIVGRGEIVTPETEEILRALQNARQNGRFPRALSWARRLLLLALLLVGVASALVLRKEKLWSQPILAVTLLNFLLVAGLYSLVVRQGYALWITALPYLAVTLSVTVDMESALILSALGALVIGLYAGGNMGVSTYNLITAWTAGLLTQRLKDRYQIYLTMGIVFLSGLLVGTGFGILREESLKTVALGTFLTAALSGFLVLGLLPLIEKLTGVTTDFLLLELSNLNNPLLRELAQRAPGTFSHSLHVGNLAEAGARAIGANPLLARVAAYYHDIGKVKRPHYFIENLMGRENPHNKLPPRVSAMILISHVKEGLDMARKARLPREIRNVIASHHGTTLMVPFYHKARQQDPSVSEEMFRYPGPKPRSKEEALVMLADAVEAAARSLDHPSALALRETIQRVIQSRLEDRQLDEAPLTRRDLQAIEDAFFPVLVGIFHPRIEYPPHATPHGEKPAAEPSA